MSREYTSKLISEIDLYLTNLHKFQSYDFSLLETEYHAMIEGINTTFAKLTADAQTKAGTVSQKQIEDASVIREAKRELEVLEKQYRDIENKEASLKKKISSLRTKIKKAQAEREHIAENINDPLRRLLGYKNSDNEKIAALDTEIKKYNDEIEEIKEEIASEDKRILDQRIKTLRESIKQQETDSVESLKNEHGTVVDEKAILEALATTLQVICDEKANEFLALETIEEIQKLLRRINTTEIKGYALMNYKNLLEVVALYPNNLYGIGLEKTQPYSSFNSGIELDESYSAACQERFKELCCIRPKGTVEVQDAWDKLYLKRMSESTGEFVFPEEVQNLNDTTFYNLIYEVKSVTNNAVKYDPLLEEAARFAVQEEQITTSTLQRKFKLSFGRAAQLVNELEQIGVISAAQGTKPRTILKYNLESIDFSGQAGSVSSIDEKGKLKISQDTLDVFEYSKSKVTEKLIKGTYISEKFLLKLKKMLEDNPEMDLPDIAIELREDEIDEHVYIAEAFISFRNLYRETPEQILKTNQEFFARKEIEQISENARKEREMYERQAALDREAENERARMMAEAESERAKAERERAAAIERQTSSMAHQASLDRAAAERRAERATSSVSSTPPMKRSYNPALDKDKEYVSGVGYRDTFGNYYDHNGKPIPAPISIKDKK